MVNAYNLEEETLNAIYMSFKSRYMSKIDTRKLLKYLIKYDNIRTIKRYILIVLNFLNQANRQTNQIKLYISIKLAKRRHCIFLSNAWRKKTSNAG